MMKTAVLTILIACFGAVDGLEAQKYFTRNGTIEFFSKTPIENIRAVNNSATSVLDTETGRLEFAVLIKGFQFPKARMQQDFNENFMHSSKYPKAVFKGTIDNWESIRIGDDGTHELMVSGDLTIRGVTKPLKTTAELTVEAGALSAHSKFMLEVSAFDIEVPSVVRQKIAEKVEVTVDVDYQALEGQDR
jgi:hypothetical protein